MSTTQDEIRKELQRAHPRDVEAVRWYTLYLKCTPKEREEMTAAMLARIESRETESIEIYKRDPDLLRGLTVTSLRDVADQSIQHAHQWIVTRYPDVADLLIAFECLSSFSMGTNETISHMELADVISSLKEVWKLVSVETKGTPA